MSTNPCQCWLNPVILHAGHCCFAYPDPTGTIYRPDGQLPCGHTEPKEATHA